MPPISSPSPGKWCEIIKKERPDAVCPPWGGQTALNCALELEQHGVLAEFGVR